MVGTNANVKLMPVTDRDGNVSFTVLVLGEDGTFSEFPVITLNGVEVKPTSVVKNLGLMMNYRLSWNNHVDSVYQKIFAGLRSLWPFARSTPIRTRSMLAKALLMPHFDYCCEIYAYGLDASSAGLLDKAFRSVVRYVYGKGKYDSISSEIDRFLGYGLKDHLRMRSMSFIYKTLATGSPSYLSELFQIGRSERTRQLIVPRASDGEFLFVRGVVDWNALPVFVRNSGTHEAFRRRYMTSYS